MPAYEIVWCGRRTGGRRTSSVIGRRAATEATAVAESAATSSRSGRRPGMVRASSVLPEPGGPISSIAWPPARAISSARRATAWPLTSARSTTGSSSDPARTSPRPASSPPVMPALGSGDGDRRRDLAARTTSAASATVETGIGSIPGASACLGGRVGRHDDPVDAAAASAIAIGRIPGTWRTSPPRPSSPIRPIRPGPARTCSDPEQDAERDREVERRAGLSDLGRGEVDRDPARRVVEPGVAQRAAHALPRLGQRGVGQADDREPRQARARRPPRRGPRGR